MCRSPSSAGIAATLALAVLGACGGAQRPAEPRCSLDRTVITSQEDVDRIATCAELGTLVVRSGAPLQLAPLQLERVRGDVIIGPTVNLEELRLTALREVDGAIAIANNTLLRAVFMPALERAGEISITGNSAVVTLSVPVLTSVRRSLVIEALASLEMLDASQLASVGQALVIAGNPRLELIELPAHVTAGELRLADNRALADETASELRTRVSTPVPN